MLLEISVRDDKAELFLQLIEELHHSVVETFHVVSPKQESQDPAWDENELIQRVNEIHQGSVTPISREEVFDGIL